MIPDNMYKNIKVLPVTSRNQWFQRIDVIKRNREKRRRYNQFFVEGVTSVSRLRNNPEWEVEAFIYCKTKKLSKWAQGILNCVKCRYHLEFSEPLMKEISDKEDTSEIIALVNRRSDNSLPERIPPLFVLLDRPGNPGNLGSIIRSCDCFGIRHIGVFGHSADIYDPAVIRASAGSFFGTFIAPVSDKIQLGKWFGKAKGKNTVIIGTSPAGKIRIDELKIKPPVVLVMGNEKAGLGKWLIDQCDILASIPMQGDASSLNLACAASIFLYEIKRIIDNL